MRFVGQHHIMNQLRFILPSLYQNSTHGANFLLVGPSGFGKTTMAISIAEYLAGKHFEYYLGDWTNFHFRKRVIFIDEVHLMKTPETLYPLMDVKEGPDAHVFILATNQNGNLPEALQNRCMEFIFDDYSDDELLLIARESAGFNASDESLMKIVEAGNRNPRIIKGLIDRFRLYFQINDVDSTTADYNEILSTVFRIDGGLDTLCRRYLETLEKVGGNASISLLASILHVSKDTLQNQIEPILARNGYIRITSKGRILV